MFRILLIDDSIFITNMITQILKTDIAFITSVHTAKEAIETLEDETPDLILLSMVLPDMDGQMVCRQLKGMASLKGVPILFLTSNSDEKSILKGFEAGASDYIVKPFSQAELKARVTCHLQNKVMADKLRSTNQRLVLMMEELKLQGYKDALTNIYNRKYFLEHIEGWKSQLKQARSKAFLYLIDIDTFKRINDTYGHSTGDYVISTVAGLLKQNIPEEAAAIRWGGDEFLLMIFGMSPKEAASMGSSIRKLVSDYAFSFDGNQFRCSLTIGFTEFYPELKIEDHINLADKALYAGKERGRNCCIDAGNLKSID